MKNCIHAATVQTYFDPPDRTVLAIFDGDRVCRVSVDLAPNGMLVWLHNAKGECTHQVTWYKDGAEPHLMANTGAFDPEAVERAFAGDEAAQDALQDAVDELMEPAVMENIQWT